MPADENVVELASDHEDAVLRSESVDDIAREVQRRPRQDTVRADGAAKESMGAGRARACQYVVAPVAEVLEPFRELEPVLGADTDESSGGQERCGRNGSGQKAPPAWGSPPRGPGCGPLRRAYSVTLDNEG